MRPLSLSYDTARRTRFLREAALGRGPVIYWMSRDQRVADNWALLAAREAAALLDRPLWVLFFFAPHFSGAASRHYKFLAEGLEEVSARLLKMNIPMTIISGNPGVTAAETAAALDAAILFTDFDPYPEKRQWKTDLLSRATCTVAETDAHNIVPAWAASQKKEYSAATFRKKIMPRLPEWLTPFPMLEPMPRENMPRNCTFAGPEDFSVYKNAPELGAPIHWITPGETAAMDGLLRFISQGLSRYAADRNDPGIDGLSNISPWLHFGHLSPQRAALEVSASGVSVSSEAFLDELIIRRELADNFCLYEPFAGTYNGLPEWARKTLDIHRSDERPLHYDISALEEARTDDPLWNAAQRQMTVRGKMHGWARMYWAKKILEWSPSPEDAFSTALSLNDRYELDGRDPNGITGVSWAIGGLHDRAWPERPVFGKVRYMNYSGAQRKFNVKHYIETTQFHDERDDTSA